MTVVAGPALSRAVVDRAGQRRKDGDWLDAAWKRARLLVLDDAGRAPVDVGPDGGSGPRLVFATPDGTRPDDAVLLGECDGDVFFARRGAAQSDTGVDGGVRRAGLREIGAELTDCDAGLLVSAVAILNWHDNYRFAPSTGAPTTMTDAGWARAAGNDRGPLWPRTDPAVIVLITDGGSGRDGCCLLGRPPSWQPGRYSCIAGFVEPGESLEAAVVREVGEEVGLVPTEVRYVASQPWPFPASLMVGFRAVLPRGSVPVLADQELEDARWFSRTEIAAAPTVLPPAASIAKYLISSWLTED